MIHFLLIELVCEMIMTVFERMSEPEKYVAEFLTELGLWWKYESPLYLLDEKDRPRIWAPDFFLPKFGIYIEVCGSEDFDYEYREDVYRKNEFRIIFLHYYKEQERWRKFLVDSIQGTQEVRNTYVENMLNVYKSKY